jgi:receptor expression-enhancing protein 5/6
LRVPPHPF